MNNTTILDVTIPEQTIADTGTEKEFYDLLGLSNEKPPVLPQDLIDLSTAEVQKLCNQVFREMDADFPRIGAQDDYETLVHELDNRAKQSEP